MSNGTISLPILRKGGNSEFFDEKWSPVPGLNQRHPVYKTGALPTELTGPGDTRCGFPATEFHVIKLPYS